MGKKKTAWGRIELLNETRINLRGLITILHGCPLRGISVSSIVFELSLSSIYTSRTKARAEQIFFLYTSSPDTVRNKAVTHLPLVRGRKFVRAFFLFFFFFYFFKGSLQRTHVTKLCFRNNSDRGWRCTLFIQRCPFVDSPFWTLSTFFHFSAHLHLLRAKPYLGEQVEK